MTVTAEGTGARRRHWADVVAIFTGFVLLGLAIWPGDPSASAGAAREAGNPQLLWGSHAFAGAAAIAAVFLAQRPQRRTIARLLLALGGLALLAVLVVFNDFGTRALLTSLLPALLLFVAATSVGPMPRDI
jgi:thiol:disulfide interchange protein